MKQPPVPAVGVSRLNQQTAAKRFSTHAPNTQASFSLGKA